MLEISYGFQCQCPTSLFLRRVGTLPGAPITELEIARVSKELREFVGLETTNGFNINTLPKKHLDTLPPSLYCVLRESFMGSLSETFSKASHEGQYNIASESGITLLSLYLLVYPLNYPQIGEKLQSYTLRYGVCIQGKLRDASIGTGENHMERSYHLCGSKQRAGIKGTGAQILDFGTPHSRYPWTGG